MKRSVAALRGRAYGAALRQRLEPRSGGLCNTLTRVQKDNIVMEIENNGKKYKIRLRKLTPRECWRLMGISDGDYGKAASVVSPTQLYKQAGNGIVVDVLAALFGKVFEALGREASINAIKT